MIEAWKAVVENVQDARSRAHMKHISYTGITFCCYLSSNYSAIAWDDLACKSHDNMWIVGVFLALSEGSLMSFIECLQKKQNPSDQQASYCRDFVMHLANKLDITGLLQKCMKILYGFPFVELRCRSKSHSFLWTQARRLG